MKDLKQRTIRGGLARLCGQAADFVLRFASLIVMARLLEPADFGLVAMVTAITGFYALFVSAGLSAPTIQAPSITDQQLSTLFWINILVGTILAVLCLITAPILVKFYGEPRLFWVTVTIATGFIINAAAVQHSAILQRHMRHITLTVIETLSQLAAVLVGVILAVRGFGYWAIVAATTTSPVVYAIGVWGATRWIPGPPQRGVQIRPMLRFGGTLMLNSVVVYVGYNLEKVLIGRLWGADVLGLYGRAYQLIRFPTDGLNVAVGGVAFSALSRLQNEPARFRSYFLKGYCLVNSLTLPTTIFCALFGDDIIAVCLGPKWTDAASIFRLLTPTVMVFGMINPLLWLLLPLGLYGRGFRIALVLAPLVIVAVVIGLPYGPTGVAFAYSAAMTLWLVPHIFWCLHGTPISPRDLLSAISGPLIAAAVAAALSFAAQFYLDQLTSPLLRLALGGGVMAVTYLSLLLLITGQDSPYLDTLRGLKGASDAGEPRAGSMFHDRPSGRDI